MIWIVSSSVAGTDENISARHEYIELVSQAHVSPWQKHVAEADRDGYIKPIVEYYQCRSENGEYGIVPTAHIDESITILNAIRNDKKTIYALNTCIVSDNFKLELLHTIKHYNLQSELYLARQKKGAEGKYFNYAENLGTFGFSTTRSEREVFMHREKGLTQAIRLAFEKITAT